MSWFRQQPTSVRTCKFSAVQSSITVVLNSSSFAINSQYLRSSVVDLFYITINLQQCTFSSEILSSLQCEKCSGNTLLCMLSYTSQWVQLSHNCPQHHHSKNAWFSPAIHLLYELCYLISKNSASMYFSKSELSQYSCAVSCFVIVKQDCQYNCRHTISSTF